MDSYPTERATDTLAIILAAGKGTRMHSDIPKVLHPVAGKPMLSHVMDAAKRAGCPHITVVTAPDTPQVERLVRETAANAEIAYQTEQLGTAHAVLAARDSIAATPRNLMVLFGDSPLIEPETIATMLRTLSKNPSVAVVVLGFHSDNPPAYGRLIIDEAGELEAIIEAKDATSEQLQIPWCNAGVMAIRGGLALDLLDQIGNRNAQNEYYLTDIIGVARRMGYRCQMVTGGEHEALGVNSRTQLAEVEWLMQQKLRAQAMDAGVTMIAPETVFLSADTQFGRDVVIEPNVVFGSNVVVGDRVEIRAFSYIDGTVIGDDAMIGPFARLRPGTNIGAECKIGNFVEIKKAEIERGAKISHLSYIGDAHVGEDANIGAGTITCNYDGYKKYHTEIGRDVFIGSNSALVAPVVIGAGAYVGAGSVVTENVKPDALAVARSRQAHKDDWANAFRSRMEQDPEKKSS